MSENGADLVLVVRSKKLLVLDLKMFVHASINSDCDVQHQLYIYRGHLLENQIDLQSLEGEREEPLVLHLVLRSVPAGFVFRQNIESACEDISFEFERPSQDSPEEEPREELPEPTTLAPSAQLFVCSYRENTGEPALALYKKIGADYRLIYRERREVKWEEWKGAVNKIRNFLLHFSKILFLCFLLGTGTDLLRFAVLFAGIALAYLSQNRLLNISELRPRLPTWLSEATSLARTPPGMFLVSFLPWTAI